MKPLEHNGRYYVCRASIDGWRNAERTLCASMITLARRLADGLLTLDEAIIVLGFAMDEGDRPDIGDMVCQWGLQRTYEILTELFLQAFAGSDALPKAITHGELDGMMKAFPD